MKLRTKKQEIRITERVGEEQATFVITPITPKENAELVEAVTIKEWDRGQRFERVDFYQYKIMKIDKIIRGWEDIEDEKGTVLPCTKENKELVYAFNVELIDKVLEKADGYSKDIIEDKEGLEKNSLTGLTGKTDQEG